MESRKPIRLRKGAFYCLVEALRRRTHETDHLH